MSIAKLQAALAVATNEITMAAANLNFDFTLVKYEAPKEYHDLGKALSQKRRENAEAGQAHITARRLGALFEGVCGPSPNLIKAYGRRVSEIGKIAQEDSAKQKGNLLESHAGIDGTSIWAAATSSPSALQIQLLACMLARFWTAPEAISVWVELVKERRKHIAREFDEDREVKYASLAAAAQADISRSSLAEWDASARAWLGAADRVKMFNQKQLMLILDNVNVRINNDMAVYPSVTTAWKSAIDSIEKIVSGMPQAVNYGPTLLALSAWHLYPDILTLGKSSCPHIRFGDDQVAEGGTLTVGLENQEGTENRGVYWSLSLAHLNHYGKPVKRDGVLLRSPQSISSGQFALVVLGCILGRWKLRGGDARGGARLFVELQKFLDRRRDTSLGGRPSSTVGSPLRDSLPWWRFLADAAQTWLDTDDEYDDVHRLFRLGVRRSEKFMPKFYGFSEPYFGLIDESIFLTLLAQPEHRVALLRRLVNVDDSSNRSSIQLNSVIRYDPGNTSGLFELATLVPRKRNEDPSSPTSRHCRWFPNSNFVFSEWEGELEDVHRAPARPYWKRGLSRFSMWNRFTSVHDSYVLTHGDASTAAIFQIEGDQVLDLRPISIDDLIQCLKKDECSEERIVEYIESCSEPSAKAGPFASTLTYLEALYRKMPSAKVDVKVFNQPMTTAKWCQNQWQTNCIGTIEVALACVAYMASGIDIHPSAFRRVFGIAFEDSLYIDMRLLRDPCTIHQAHELKHVIGNVGRPGLTLLISPQNPVIRASDTSSWKVIRNATFNGAREDHFDRTTLHLSFTEYYVPTHIDGDQGQDAQVYYLESVVSVHDSGLWVGDIDIQESLQVTDFYLVPTYLCDQADLHQQKTPYHSNLISAENWDEILDLPPEATVIRTHNNWSARLAVVGILHHLDMEGKLSRSVVLCHPDLCWKCAKTKVPRMKSIMRPMQRTDHRQRSESDSDDILIY